MFIKNFSASMKGLRKVALVLFSLLVCSNLCVPAFAGTGRTMYPSHNLQQFIDEITGVIDAVVTEVQGTILKLDGGITVDTSGASIFTFTTSPIYAQPISPGSSVRITFSLPADPSAPLKAEFVRIRVPNEMAFCGLIQEVQLEANQDGFITAGYIKLLNRRFTVVPTGFANLGIKRKQLKVGQMVSVVAQVNGTEANIILVLPKFILPSIFP